LGLTLPLRWAAGADAIRTFEQKARDLLAQADAYRELSSSLAFDEGRSAGTDEAWGEARILRR